MKETIQQTKERIKQSINHQAKWRKSARESFDFRIGRQYTDDEEAALEEAQRPAIVFNRTGPVIDAIIGHHINNQNDIKVIPRNIQSDASAQIYTQAIGWVDDECDAADEITQAFEDCIICGVGVTEIYLTYDENPDGDIISAAHVPCLEMGWDHNAKRRNLLDARWVYRKKTWGRKEAEERWPKLKEIATNSHSLWLDDEDSAEPHDAANAWRYENRSSNDGLRGAPDEVTIIQYQWWEHTKIYRIADPQSGKIIELDPRRFERIKPSLDMNGVPYIEQMKKVWYQRFIAGDEILEENKLPVDGFTFHFMTGKRDAIRRLWLGIVEGMKDPQRWSNKFFAEIQDFMSANRRGGAFAELDAFQNPRAAEEQWNDHGALILLNPGGLGKIQERNAVNYPSGLDRLMQIAISAIPDTSGINLEMMGLVDRAQPGVVERSRKQSAVTILAPFFRALAKYQRTRATQALEFIRKYISDDRMIRILDENDAQYIQMIRDDDSVEYDIIIEDAPLSPNRKDETFAVLMNLLPQLAQMGMGIPPSLPKYLPLPKSLVDEWIASEQNKQPSPEDQARLMRAQAESQLMAAKTQGEMAGAQLDIAKSDEAIKRGARMEAAIETDRIKAISNVLPK